MGTNWRKAPLANYSVARVAEGESGYNYFAYIHTKGQIIIMRENTAGTEYKYADGEFDLTTSWAGRAGLDYKDLSEL